eukprot:COSAG06_NODE_59544_length_274_cov_0.428571_1_plen_55_part_10
MMIHDNQTIIIPRGSSLGQKNRTYLHVRLRGTVHSGVALPEVVQLLELLLALLGL